MTGSVWAVTLPVLFAGVSETVIHVTDTVFLARVGTLDLAALAFADTLLDVWTVPVIGLVGALQIVIARRVGERQRRAVGPTFANGMLALVGTAALLGMALFLGAPWLSALIVQSAEIGERVTGFLRIAAFGLPFYSLTLGFIGLFIGLAQTRILVSATVVLAGSNLILSYGLILGRLGMPALGIEGAALAFVGAEALTFGFLLVRVWREGILRGLGGLRPRSAAAMSVGRLTGIGAPISLESLLEAVRWLLFFFVLQQVSDEAVAWSNILYACYGVLLIPAGAFADTTDALVSNVIGRGRADAVQVLMRKIVAATYAVTLPLLAVALVAPDLVLSLFAEDPGTLEGASPALRVLATAMLLVVPADLWLSAVVGTGDTGTAFAIELLLSTVLVTWTYVAAVGLELPLTHVWASLGAISILGLGLSYWWVRARHWELVEV